MSSKFKLNCLTVGMLSLATLTSSLTLDGLTAQQAQAQVNLDQFIDCGNAPGEEPCVNAAGGGLPVVLFIAFFENFFNNQINYAARGSGAGISAFLVQSPPTGIPTVPTPFTFASTDAPLTQLQLNQYYYGPDGVPGSINPATSGRWELGYGPPVEMPIISSGIAVVYNVPAPLPAGQNTIGLGGPLGPTGTQSGVDLTVAQYCGLFDHEIQPGTPPELAAATGVRRTDGSGTTFIISSHLEAVCGPLGLWDVTDGGVGRGSGQVSVNEIAGVQGPAGDVCERTPVATVTNPATERTNTVCWPSTFLSGSGEPGVASTVSAAEGRFGYVGFPTAAVEADGDVDVDLNPTTASGAPRVYSQLEVADLQNPNGSGTYYAPFSGNVAQALDTLTDVSLATCRIVLLTSAPADGYPIAGVSYLLDYGDYNPDRQGANPALNSPSAGRFNNQGAIYTPKFRFIFQQAFSPAGEAVTVQQGSAPLPQALQTTVLQRVIGGGGQPPCIQANTGGNNTLDPVPTSP